MVPGITHQRPTASEYNELRKLAEWPTFEKNIVEEALLKSLFSVVVHDNNDTEIRIGFCREVPLCYTKRSAAYKTI